MLLPLAAVAIGIVLLLWSSDRFVEGAAALAAMMGVSQLLIGMIVVGFGTSLPEMTVSALSSIQGNAGIALGNAYGSNTANITLILGITALLRPIPVHSAILKRELPLLGLVTLLAAVQIGWDFSLNRLDGVALLAAFAVIMYLTVRNERRGNNDSLEKEVEEEASGKSPMPAGKAIFWVVAGLAVLVASSRLLVWGAVEAARLFGVSDLAIGLTIVAVGTSLPELASSVAAARKGHHDIAIGNVIGSNLFNTLVVVGIAACIRPMTVEPILLYRDMLCVGIATIVLYLVCVGWKGKPAIVHRWEGAVLLAMFVAYTLWVVSTASAA